MDNGDGESGFVVVLMLVVLGLVWATALHAEQLAESDLTYLGSYRVPAANNGEHSTAYGVTAFTLGDDGLAYVNSGPAGRRDRVMAFRPPPIDQLVKVTRSYYDHDKLPVGTVERQWHNAVGPVGNKSFHDPSDRHLVLKNLYARGDDLFCTIWHTYNVAGKNYPALMRGPATLDGSSVNRNPPDHYGDFKGPWRFFDEKGNRIHNEAIGGWMTPIPQSMRDRFGGHDTLIGNSLTWRASANNGPSAYSFSIDETKQGGEWKPFAARIDAQIHLEYIAAKGVDGPSFWTGTNSVGGGAVVQAGNRSALVFFGRQADTNKRRTYAKHWVFLWTFGYPTTFAPQGNQGYHAELPPTDEEVVEQTNGKFSNYNDWLVWWRTVRPSRDEVMQLGGPGKNIALKMALVDSYPHLGRPKLAAKSVIWLYEIDGQRNREPYLTIDIDDRVFPHRYRELTGIGYDLVRKQLHVAQSCGSLPGVVHVWQIGGKQEERTEQVTIKFTPSELGTLQTAADESGLSVDEYIRQEVLK